MADLGFRSPRFSEESAWVPAWLQQSHEPAQELLSSSQCQFEDVVSAQKSSPDREGLIMVHQDAVQTKRICLFLSGEGSSLVGSASTHQDECHLCLHLSTDGNSWDSESQLPFVSHSQHHFNKLPPLPQVEISPDFSKKPHQSNEQNDATRADVLLPSCILETKEFVGPQVPRENMECAERLEEQFHFRKHQKTDTKDAVEFSIAASEALVIQELVGNASCSEALPVTAVLEAVLKMKKARLESSRDDFEYLAMENDEIDCLSDLDDLVMADAYEDAGLSFTSSHDQKALGSNASQVKDTPITENHYWCVRSPGSAEEISRVSATVEKSDFLGVGLSLQLRDTGESCDAQFAKHAVKEDSSIRVTADRMRCHALDGHTGKFKPKAKEVPKQFFGETSYLSESFNIAPDENSVVEKHEMRSNATSKQILLSGGPDNHDDKDIFISQDMQFPPLSSPDPLCSIVPCSISSSLVMNQNDLAAQGENLPSALNINEESIGCMQAFGILRGECSVAAVQKQSTSLKPDGRKEDKHKLSLENAIAFCNESFLADLGNDAGSIKISDKINPEGSSEDRFKPSCAKGKDNEAKETPSNFENQISVLMKHKRKHDESTNSCKIKLQKVKERRSPLILNGRMCQHLQSSRLFIYGSLKKKHFKIAAGQETGIDPVTQACKTEVPIRKQVCLSDLQIEHQKDCHSGHKKCLPARFSKRTKYGIQNQEFKYSFTTHIMEGKGYIFQDVEFLLTGLSNEKEQEIEGLIRKYGGVVLPDIPHPPNSVGRRSQCKFERHPIILCSRKLQTTKFLYGCAVRTLILKVKWVVDSISAGSKVSPERYMVLAERSYINLTRVKRPISYYDNKSLFHRVGIMLHGKHNFCCKFAKIILHGGGQVFKTLQALLRSLNGGRISLAVIVAEDETSISRHLRHYASEKEIPLMTTCWIIKSLHSGLLLPVTGDKPSLLQSVMIPELPPSHAWSQEI